MKKLIAIIVTLVVASSAYTQNIISTPGDTMSDILVRGLSPSSVVVARPGGDGVVAYLSVQNGSSRFVAATTTTLLIAPVANTSYPLQPLSELEPITVTARIPFLLVTRKGHYKTIEEVLSSGKPISLGGFGAVSACAIAANILRRQYGTDIIYVPYKSSTQLAVDVTGGFVDIACQTADVLDSYVLAGKWTALVNLGSGDLGLPRLKNFPQIDILFFLLGKPGDTQAGTLLEELKENRNTINLPRFSVPLLSRKETEEVIRREKAFWHKEVTMLPR